jgi:multidrug efflux pump subunit AcrB
MAGDMSMTPDLGYSGRIARAFQRAQLTPLLALLLVLLGMFAILVTPREEEPQINVTMANVLIPFPGASTKNVEQMVTIPAEQVLSQIANVEHVASVSRPGMAILTVQFAVGVPRTEALVRLYDTIHANQDWLPTSLGVLPPLIKPKGIDDVPIVAVTLYGKSSTQGSFELERIAHSMEIELKRVKGTREVKTLGGPGRAINIDLDPARLASSGVTTEQLRQALQSANQGVPLGDLISGNRRVALDAGPFLPDARAMGELIVGVHDGRPVRLQDVARVADGAPQPVRYTWYGTTGKQAAEYPAVTLSITKQPGQNAVAVAEGVTRRLDNLRNSLIPDDVGVEVTRNYGVTANDKALKLIEKLLFATLSVVALVWLALGRREAAIVGTAVGLTLLATLFASWAWGFTLNRVSLFALIFSIGILVDDAIVVVENIHRHQQLTPERPLSEVIPLAVNEVGGPTILATLTVIAALLPMAFVSGLMGPYMSPIPINASMGMLLSLAVAFIVTPWLAHLWLKPGHHQHDRMTARLRPQFERLFSRFLDADDGAKNRRRLGFAILGLIVLSLLLPLFGLVQLKMLPFDNKSEFQVVVDMPSDAPLEQTAALLHELGAYLAEVPDVANYQAYAGSSAPINFNGLVRQYDLRSGPAVGDIQVNLHDKSHRSQKSHAIASQLRPALQKIAARYGARLKVVEVPPGPPVLAPIVAEIYGPQADGRARVARALQQVFSTTPGVVDVDDSSIADAPRLLLSIDRQKSALAGVSVPEVMATLRAGLAGDTVTYLQDQSKYPAGVVLRLPLAAQGNLDQLLALEVQGSNGHRVALRELVSAIPAPIEQPIYHKDLLAVNYVVGDMAGRVDSPLYGMFAMRPAVLALNLPGIGKLDEYFIHQPDDPYRNYAVKWDGEWQITYETFRDMGTAYAVGLILIYLLVVAQFKSYLTPLVIMAPIPLTLIGVMPGHALLGAQFTATSMIGMIALAGIIVRNSILLVDFINLQLADGVSLESAVVNAAVTRAQPIVLTGLAAMMGALFILDDPIFNGLAISLIFGILVSTLLTLVVIPLLYYVTRRGALETKEPVQ